MPESQYGRRVCMPGSHFVLSSFACKTTRPFWSFQALLFGVLLFFGWSMLNGCSDSKRNQDSFIDAQMECTEENCEEGDTAEAISREEAESTDEPNPEPSGPIGGTFVTPQENCYNQEDDDGDGLVDCQDPLCFGKSACIESSCDDELDNDGDGLIDCWDSDCDFSVECNPESCGSVYDCMVAAGCDCIHGLDCPLQGTDDYGACQQQCFASPNCRNNCISALSIETQENMAALQGCVVDCYISGKGWGECLFEECLEEFANCYVVGEGTCEEFFFECIYGCGGNPNCSENCFGELGPDGYVDFIEWNQCRLSLCDLNGDNTVDSQACSNVAGMVACLNIGGSCIPANDEGSCESLTQCVLGCESMGDSPCLASCISVVGAPLEQRELISQLFTCGLNACQKPGQALTPVCLAEAFETKCAAFATECGLPETDGLGRN